MKQLTMETVQPITDRFVLPGQLVQCSAYGNGHINDTFLAIYRENGQEKRYIFQTVNINVLKKPEQVMENIRRIAEHLRAKSADAVLDPLKTKDGGIYYIDADGRFWRGYDFIENSVCYELPEEPEAFYQCAYAFGKFQRDLADFPAELLYETIPDFHNTPRRYENFAQAVREDVCKRADSVREEIRFLEARQDFCSVLLRSHKAGQLPLRVSHNDTKCNNVLLTKDTGKALCVIDLDTVMPGFSVTDFGDAIRFGASTAAEDETDLSRVHLDLNKFRVYTEGFLDGCGGLLTASEIRLLPEGAMMMTLESGLRFLEDYLRGDVYFKADRPTHNLDRCRTQLKLVAEMEAHWQEMKDIVEACLPGNR